jgi:hypothetical protein
MKVDAFINSFEDNKLYDVLYYHMPNRWGKVDFNDIVFDHNSWSEEIKFLDENETGVSNEIKTLPQDCGGIYIFFIKGVLLPYFETYIAYIGRAQFSDKQNLKIRCNAYYYEFFKNDTRPKIERMIAKWGKYLYLRYYPSIDNNFIKKLEVKLINGILPPFNDEIPELKPIEAANAF